MYTTFICFFLAVVVSLCSEWAGGTSAKKKLEVPRSVGRYKAMMEKVSGKVSRKCIADQRESERLGGLAVKRKWKKGIAALFKPHVWGNVSSANERSRIFFSSPTYGENRTSNIPFVRMVGDMFLPTTKIMYGI